MTHFEVLDTGLHDVPCKCFCFSMYPINNANSPYADSQRLERSSLCVDPEELVLIGQMYCTKPGTGININGTAHGESGAFGEVGEQCVKIITFLQFLFLLGYV